MVQADGLVQGGVHLAQLGCNVGRLVTVELYCTWKQHKTKVMLVLLEERREMGRRDLLVDREVKDEE